MFAFTGLPAISSHDLAVTPAPNPSRQLSHDAYHGSLVIAAQRARRKHVPLAPGTHRSCRFFSLLIAR